MSLEVGGRADKIGNTYEDHYLVWLYILLFREELQSVIVEPLGDEGEGVEYIAQHPDGRLEYYQCKRSNAAEDKWRICDLDKYKVFSRSRQHLGNHPNALYHFISPLPYDSLDELCNRARTNSSLEEFESFQLNSIDLKTLFPKCCSSYGFIHEEETGREQTKELLSRSFFETIPDTPSRERELESWLSLFFSGDSVQLLALLSNYANEKKHYGKPIIATDLVSFLTTNNYVRRLSTNSPSVVQKIKDQNDSYYQMYRPIQRQLFRREATQDILHYVVDQNESVIVHGKPGSGKSGCIQELIDSFKEQEIPYLAIKLDKNKPEGTADQFGHSMDLPDSPVFCLHRLAGSRLSVLILDQLDSLRWTELHSSKSLEICKALIAQAKVINQHQDGNVRIVFVCRTFDLETDQGLKQLFESQSDESETWQKVSVGLLSNDEVKAIVGPDYDNLSLRLQKLLQTPSSLYFWLQVRNAGGQTGNIATTFGLLQEWWRQVPRRLVGKGISKETLIECKDKIIQTMGRQERHTIPRAPSVPAYKPGTDMGPAKIVTSPVSGHADKLSERQWLRIIEKPMETDPRKYHPWKETKDCYIETSPDQFASSLSSQAKKEPERFARMAMHFPADCYHGYIIGVMDGIAFCSEEAKMPPIEIMVELIKKYAMLEPATELAACRIIEHFPDNQWPEWIWRMLLEYTGREDDRITPGTYTDEGERKWTYSELGTVALNSVPGEAVEAIAKICWDNPKAQAYFLDHVYTFIHDPREVIRFSAFNCAMAFFNLKEPISRDMIKQLINEDVRFITAPGIAQIINRLFIADVAFYQEKLITASQINNHDVSKDALRFITDLAILHHDQRLLDYLQQGHFSADQVNTICHEAAHYFDDNKYNSLCKELIMPHIAELKSFGIAELYRSNKLHLERDRDFLIAIMRMNQDPYIVNHFLEYIDESDADLEQYAEIIYAIGMSTAMSEDHHGVWGLVEHVSNCTIKLFDRSKENAHIRRMCLEIWDALFRNQHTIIKRIAETLDEGLV